MAGVAWSDVKNANCVSHFECLARDHSVRETLHVLIASCLNCSFCFYAGYFRCFQSKTDRLCLCFAQHPSEDAHRRFRRLQRRLNIRRRFWRLPRPVYSWFDIHFNDHLLRDQLVWMPLLDAAGEADLVKAVVAEQNHRKDTGIGTIKYGL